jgi:hypothetical protein
VTVSPSVPPLPADCKCSPRFVRGRSLGGPGIEAAVQLAQSSPDIRVRLFESSWSAVDHARTLIESLGLSSRITAHHQDAWLWVLDCSRRAA